MNFQEIVGVVVWGGGSMLRNKTGVINKFTKNCHARILLDWAICKNANYPYVKSFKILEQTKHIETSRLNETLFSDILL